MKIHSVSLKSLPNIVFAHQYTSENYDMEFPEQPNFIEISYIQNGEITIIKENEIERVPENAIMISIRKEKERTLAHAGQSHITVGFTVELGDGDELQLPNYAVFPNAKKYYERLNHIVKEFTLQRKTTTGIAGMLFTLLADIDAEYRKFLLPRDTNYSEKRYAERAKRYVVNHLSEKIYVADIARATGLSVGYLSNLFRRVTGQTLVEYVNITKLQKVKELTEIRKMTVREASASLGYEDENYVSRIYKKYFGCNLTES